MKFSKYEVARSRAGAGDFGGLPLKLQGSFPGGFLHHAKL